jgi:hypothetical protein
MIGLGVGTVRNGKCATSEIPRLRVGRRVLFSLRAVEAWMQRRTREAEERKVKARQESLAGLRCRQWMIVAAQRQLQRKRKPKPAPAGDGTLKIKKGG